MAARPRFDVRRPLVAARDFTFMGVNYKKGDPFTPEGASDRLRARQYESRAVDFAQGEAGPDGTVELVTMTGPSGGRYTITAPWLSEPEVVRGKQPAEKRLAQLREEGAPLGFIDGGTAVTVEGGEGGWYEVSAPWLDEPEKVQGREAAEARQRAIHDAGEPEVYKDVAVVAGDNGWYTLSRVGKGGEMKVHGEEAARLTAAKLRAGEDVEDQPADWSKPAEGAEQQGQTGVEGQGDQAPTEDTTVQQDKTEQTADTAPNEPGTNESNGAEVINDKENAGEGGGDQDGEGDDAGRPVGP